LNYHLNKQDEKIFPVERKFNRQMEDLELATDGLKERQIDLAREIKEIN